MGASRSETLIPVGEQVAVDPLTQYKGAPRVGAIDLHLNESTAFLRPGPTSHRLVEGGESEEVDEHDADCDEQKPTGSIHKVEAIGPGDVSMGQDGRLGR